jgi:transposase
MLDAAIRSAGVAARFTNAAKGHRELLNWLTEQAVRKVVMEATGGSEISCRKVLARAGLEGVIVDPKRVRHFARSAGQLAKSDPIDAQMIAWFGEVFDELTGEPQDGRREQLEQLVGAHQALKRLQGQIENWGEHEQPRLVHKAHQVVPKAITSQLDTLDDAIAAQIDSCPQFAERAEIIHSVPGLGDVSTAGIIAFLPELGRVDRQAAAALLGVAPFDADSGQHHGRRYIQGGRRKLRNLLYMPIVGAATRSNPVLKACYLRHLARGKQPKVALMACLRKLIGILNTMLARGKKWNPAKHVLA